VTTSAAIAVGVSDWNFDVGQSIVGPLGLQLTAIGFNLLACQQRGIWTSRDRVVVISVRKELRLIVGQCKSRPRRINELLLGAT
jgi:hypothetical protein